MVGLTVLIACMGQLHRLIRAAEVSAQPVPIASGTRLLPVCRVRAARGFPPHARLTLSVDEGCRASGPALSISRGISCGSYLCLSLKPKSALQVQRWINLATLLRGPASRLRLKKAEYHSVALCRGIASLSQTCPTSALDIGRVAP